METDAGDVGKGNPMCVRDLDGYGAEIGRSMQIELEDRDNRDRGSESRDLKSVEQEVGGSSPPNCTNKINNL
jgi:hypothetical protein